VRRTAITIVAVLVAASAATTPVARGQTERAELDAADRPTAPRIVGDRLGGVGPGIEIQATVEPGRGRSATPGIVEGTPEELRALLASGNAASVERRFPPQEQATSQGVGIVGASAWHAAGLTGSGVRVAIVDTGFLGYESLLGGDLPATVTTRSFRFDGGIHGGSRHGTAVAEIVHDVAPGASLYLVAIESDELAPVVDYLIANQIDVVNTSVGWLQGPLDGNSDIAGQVDRAIDAGVIWVASAGNYAEQHWGGQFTDTDGDGWAEFAGTTELNGFTVDPGATFEVALSWQNAATDYDLCLFDAGLVQLACSGTVQQPGDRPVDWILWSNFSFVPTRYHYAVIRHNGPPSRFDVLSGDEAFDFDFADPATSLPVPADVERIVTVGAVPWFATSSLATYSGRGPTVDGRVKPDLVSPTSVANSTFGPFSGTSASSPHVAGLAALYLGARPLAQPETVRAILGGLAAPRSIGKSNEFGWGLSQAGPALGPDTSPPTWGAGSSLVVGSIGDRWVELAWAGATDAEGIAAYRVLRDGVLVAQVPSNVAGLRVNALQPSSGYTFAVQAADPSGNWSTGPAVAAVTAPPSPPPTVGLVDTASGTWHLRNSIGVDTAFAYGNPGDFPMVGDWDCDGIDTPGLYRQADGFVYLRNSNTQGVADIRFFFGNPSDLPLAGDFDGDGCDTVSVYRPGTQTFLIINELGANGGSLGRADFSYVFGNPGDKPFVGDFDADGLDTMGLHRESTGFVYFRNSHTTGNANAEFFFGNPDDRLVSGDWTSDGFDNPGLFRPALAQFSLRFTNTQGNADTAFFYGENGWIPVSGQFGLG
jgi:hypothetical protein